MKEITNFKDLKKFFCTKCDTFHRKVIYNPYLKKQVISKKWKEHKEFAVELDSHELWTWQFKKSWRRNAKQQAKDGKPIGIPKKRKKVVV